MKLEWTDQAIRGWQQVAQYILEDFGQRRLATFQRETEEEEKFISQFPNMGTIAWEDKELSIVYRFRVINGLSKMLYFVSADTIFIADFWDVRQNGNHKL